MNIFMGLNSKGKQLWQSWSGSIGSTGGTSANIIINDIGPITQSRNRVRIALNENYERAANGVSWALAQNIREVTCIVTAISGVVADVDAQNYIDVVINASSEAEAGVMLADVDSANTDAPKERFLIGERFTIRSKTPITNLDFLPVDNAASMSSIKLWVGAH